jgi:Peptidase M15
MTALTEHFSEEELGVAGCDPRLANNAKALCDRILEPIRDQYGEPLRVHDGYRDPGHNARVGGKAASWHLYSGTQAAADIDVQGIPLREVFDWVRLKSGLPFDKVILETNAAGIPACIHLQFDYASGPRRLAYIGGTGNSQSYTPMSVGKV